MSGKIGLTILGGYLGAGKTTWLRHQLFEGAFGTTHILVNEAAETPVDDALLSAQASGITLLAGGCACCKGRTELVTTLRNLCDTRAQTQITRLVLETSGLADPASILSAIRADPVLVHHLKVDDIIVLVDTFHAGEQLREDALSRVQIEAADRIILTKPDRCTPEQIAAVRATVAKLNPIAEISASDMGVPYPLEGLPNAAALPLPRLEADALPITPCRIDVPAQADWASFSVWLSALLHAHGDHLVRVKGVMQTPAGALLLQAVRKSVQAPEILPESASAHQNQIAFIGRGYDPSALERSLRHFTE